MTGYSTPEDAARGHIPVRFVHVLGVQMEDDTATVWMLTNDHPPFEPYEVVCGRAKDGSWEPAGGSGGFNVATPDDVLARARQLGW